MKAKLIIKLPNTIIVSSSELIFEIDKILKLAQPTGTKTPTIEEKAFEIFNKNNTLFKIDAVRTDLKNDEYVIKAIKEALLIDPKPCRIITMHF